MSTPCGSRAHPNSAAVGRMSDFSRPPDFLPRYYGGTEHSTGASAECGRGRDQVVPARGREGRDPTTDGRRRFGVLLIQG